MLLRLSEHLAGLTQSEHNLRMRLMRLVLAVATFGCLVVSGSSASSPMTVELRGFGNSLGLSATCPAGLTQLTIIGSDRHALDCVLSARKLSKPGLDPWRIIESAQVTTPFPAGTIRDNETQTFTFTRSGWKSATFHGDITGGTGRYKDASGTVTGSGTHSGVVAVWHLTFRLR
jgi:hypothetical protein